MRVYYSFFIALIILFVSGCNTSEKKQVVAVQALFQEENTIDSIWQKALLTDKVTCARSIGSRPHMTIASFNLSRNETNIMTKALKEMNNQYPSYPFKVRLLIKKEDENLLCCYLVPVVPDSTLIRMHDSLYMNIDKGFERLRKIDMPGSWLPHISMFEVQGDSATIPDELIKEMDKIQTLTLKGFSMVRFGPIQYFNEIQTQKLN